MRVGALIPVGIVVAVAVVVLSPPGHLVLRDSCTIDGAINRARAAIQRERFWVKQLTYLDRDLAFAREWPNRSAHMRAEMDSAMEPILSDFNADTEKWYREHPELRPTPEDQQAEQLRDQANAAEARDVELHMRHVLAEHARDLERLRPLVLRRIEAGR
jgi:hypothetical protein